MRQNHHLYLILLRHGTSWVIKENDMEFGQSWTCTPLTTQQQSLFNYCYPSAHSSVHCKAPVKHSTYAMHFTMDSINVNPNPKTNHTTSLYCDYWELVTWSLCAGQEEPLLQLPEWLTLGMISCVWYSHPYVSTIRESWGLLPMLNMWAINHY